MAMSSEDSRDLALTFSGTRLIFCVKALVVCICAHSRNGLAMTVSLHENPAVPGCMVDKSESNSGKDSNNGLMNQYAK